MEELIDPITGWWDEELLRANLWSVDVEPILRIPLPTHDQSDFIAWLPNKNGCFSVKSAYHLEWRIEYRRRALRSDGTDRSSPHEVWKKIWQIPVARKVQIFTWRALHGIIPCLCTLANRHIGSSVNCPVCSFDGEDLKHMLFVCSRAMDIWQGLELEDCVKAALVMDRPGSMILEELICSSRPGGVTCRIENAVTTIMIACWYIGWLRRKIKNKEEVPCQHPGF